MTKGDSKQLLSDNDNTLIHYPFGPLLLAVIRKILIKTIPGDLSSFQRILGDGSTYGASFTCAVRATSNGLSEAFIIDESFIAGNNGTLILGYNTFPGVGPGKQLKDITLGSYETIFVYKVSDSWCYGVVEFSKGGKVLSIEAKPAILKSNYVVPGLYIYETGVIEIAKLVKPSNVVKQKLLELMETT